MVAAFQTPVDIANRALQHIGSPRIAAFADNSKPASEANFAYDKTRRSELRRAVWAFSKRRVVLRAITTTSHILSPATYNAGTTYAAFAIVADTAGAWWQSLQSANTGNTPAVGSAFWTAYYGAQTAEIWATGVTYYAGDLVYKAGGNVYISNANANAANDPVGGSPWVNLGADGTVAVAMVILNPIAYGPTGGTARSLYRLPYGFIRTAVQDIKSPSTLYQNTTGGMRFSDWEVQKPYLITASAGPLFFQYVADIVDVPYFEELFCEALAARLGLELCEPLTQSGEKIQLTAKLYDRYIGEARQVNLIEAGSAEPDEMGYEPLAPVNPTDQQRGGRPQQGQ
jgi:hypothetical protein